MSVPYECSTKVSHKSVPQECLTRVALKSVPQECPIRVSHKRSQECPTRLSHKSALQECPTRVFRKSVPQECPTGVSHKSVLQECPTRVSHKSVLQECFTRVSHKSVPQECLLRRARCAPRCLAGRGGRAGGPFDARPLRRGPARRPPRGPLCPAARGTPLGLLGRCVRYLRPRSGGRRIRRAPGRLTRPRQRACALGQNPGLERRR